MILLALLASAVFGDGSKLTVGDVVGVTVDGEKEFTKTYQINKDGCISLPMIKPVKIIDLNTSDATEFVAKALKEVLINPQVTLSFVERAKMQVFVTGQVTKPGLIEVGAGDRVLQALTQAGYDDSADLTHVTIHRGDQTMTLDLQKYIRAEDLTVNAELQSNDMIVVPHVDAIGNVMILGQVNKVGTIPLKRDMTFREAMGIIGGVTVDADTEKITIKRENVVDLIKIDYKHAMDGDPAANVALKPGDLVYVPDIETSFFTVMGAVNRPGQFPLKGKLTVSEAIGLAGGEIPGLGDLRKVQLMHASTKGATPGDTVAVNLNQIIKQSGTEPMVQRGDLIYVPDHKQQTSFLQVIQSIAPFAWLLRP